MATNTGTLTLKDLLSERFQSVALNDAVVTAGPPYHLIELVLTMHGGTGKGSVHCSGDGVILSTPSGSIRMGRRSGSWWGRTIGPSIRAGR